MAASSSSGGVATAVHGKCDLGAQQVYLGALELVQRTHLGDGQQPQCGVGCARLVGGLRGGQRTLAPAGRLEGQLGRSLEERGRRG